MVELSHRSTHHLVEVALVGWRNASVHWREFLYFDDVGVDLPIVNNGVVFGRSFSLMLH
jgi:hypothetical protein